MESLAMTYSAKRREARQKAIILCADFFEHSGIEYTCLAVVAQTVAPELARLAEQAEFKPYAVNRRDILRRIGDEVHDRWVKNRRFQNRCGEKS